MRKVPTRTSVPGSGSFLPAPRLRSFSRGWAGPPQGPCAEGHVAECPVPASGRSQQGMSPLLPSTGLPGAPARPRQPPPAGPPAPPGARADSGIRVAAAPAQCLPHPTRGPRGNPASEGSREARPPLSLGPSRSTGAVPRLGTAYGDLRVSSERVLGAMTAPWERGLGSGRLVPPRRGAYRAEEAVGRGKHGPEDVDGGRLGFRDGS